MCSAWSTDHNTLLKVDPNAVFIYQLHLKYLLKWNLQTIPCLQNNNQPVSRKAKHTSENPSTKHDHVFSFYIKYYTIQLPKQRILRITESSSSLQNLNYFQGHEKVQLLGLVSSQCGYLSALSSHPPTPVSCDELIRRKYYCSLIFHIPNKAHILKQLWNFAQNPGLKAN